jgi:hypothetical protein
MPDVQAPTSHTPAMKTSQNVPHAAQKSTKPMIKPAHKGYPEKE